MRKIFIIANPISGKLKSPRILKSLIKVLEEKNIDYQTFETKKQTNAWHIVQKSLDATFTDLIVVGGDGTINEAVNGLIYDIPIGILPAGTGNDYVKALRLGVNINSQIQTAIFGEPCLVDVGICNGRKFLNGVGIGFDGQIVADMLQKRTMIHGPAKYYYHVLKNLAGFQAQNFTYSLDDIKQESRSLILLCISKGTTFGGSFRLAPDAHLTDGKLHLCQIGDMPPPQRFLNVNRLQSGTHIDLKEVKMDVATHVKIDGPASLNAHIDGEYFGHPPFEINVLPGAIRVRCL